MGFYSLIGLQLESFIGVLRKHVAAATPPLVTITATDSTCRHRQVSMCPHDLHLRLSVILSLQFLSAIG